MVTFFLDLDRTVFQTDKVSRIFDVIEELYPHNILIKNSFKNRKKYYVVPDFNNGDTMAYYHDYVRQLKYANIDYKDAFNLAYKKLRGTYFEFNNLADFINKIGKLGDVKILTFGELEYQKFKATLCPSLDGLEVIATLYPKEDYLNNYAKSDDWIIDDKILCGLNIDMNVILIDHTGLKEYANAYSLDDAYRIINGD